MPITNLSPSPAVAPPVVASQPTDSFADLDAERSLIVALLHDPASLSLITRLVPLTDFALHDHRCILAAAQRLCDRHSAFTVQALKVELEQHRQHTATNLVRSLSEQPPIENGESPAAFDRQAELAGYAHRVCHKARQRRLLDWFGLAHSRLLDGATFDAIRSEAESLFAAETQTMPPPLKGWYGAFNNLRQADLNQAEEILPALHRCEVGELLADEAQGKTALLLQVAVSLAAGEAVSPLLTAPSPPRRIVYVNDDAAPARLRDELEKLFPQVEQQALAEANFQSLLDGQLDGEAVNLSADGQWQRLETWLTRQTPDLIIFDGVQLLDPEADKPSERRRQARKLLSRLKQLAENLNCAVLVAHSTITNGNRRRLGNLVFAAAHSVYHFRSDHRYRDDYRWFRCVHSQWTLPEAIGLQREAESGGYELAPATETTGRGGQANKDLPTIMEVVEFLGDGWQEIDAITQHFEGRANSQQVAKLIKEAYLYGWIFRQGKTLPWQLAKRGKAAFAESKAKAAENAAAAKHSATTNEAADGLAVSGEEKNCANTSAAIVDSEKLTPIPQPAPMSRYH